MLGSGKVTERLVVVRMDVSKKAAKKIEESGGRIEEAQPENGKENAGEEKQ